MRDHMIMRYMIMSRGKRMVRPKRLRKPRKSTPTPTGKINLHTLLSLEEDQALADEASRRNISKSDVIRAWIAALPKGKPSKG